MERQGEKHYMSKLNEKQVRVIQHLKNIKPKMKQWEIAKIFGVVQQTIQKIHSEENWQHL